MVERLGVRGRAGSSTLGPDGAFCIAASSASSGRPRTSEGVRAALMRRASGDGNLSYNIIQ